METLLIAGWGSSVNFAPHSVQYSESSGLFEKLQIGQGSIL